MSHITGCSRPPGEVGLTPRQYTEWNVAGHARSTGDLSQQGLLPEVYRTACTRGCAHQNDQIPKNPGSCTLVVYIAGDTSHHQPMGASYMTAPVTWAYGIPCPAMVSPNAGPGKEDKLLHLDDHLIWCSKVDSGPHTQHAIGQGGVCLWSGGGICLWVWRRCLRLDTHTTPGRHPVLDTHTPGHPPGQTPPWTDIPPIQMTFEADGKHPTGMHSCILLYLSLETLMPEL